MRRVAWCAVCLMLSCPTLGGAQGVPATSMNPPVISGNNVGSPAEQGPLPGEFQTGVSFLDSAVPRSMFRLRFDVDQYDRRPTRADYLFPGDGFKVNESRVHMQELNMFVEYGLNEWFSTFMETPYRWVNPDQNENVNGFGDLHFGLKFAGWNSDKFLTAFQLKFGADTSQHLLTGNGHWSVEPALLVGWRIFDILTLEGQAGYYVALGGSHYAGDVFKYGLGLSYGGTSPTSIGLMPVAEIVGTTVTSGRELVETAPGVFTEESAAGATTINGCLGLRFTLGHNADIYTGYSRSLVGHPWFRDMIRLELRVFY